MRFLYWSALLLNLYVVFNTTFGGLPNILALGVLLISSRLVVGNMVFFWLATLVLAGQHMNLRAEEALEAVYLPLYAMFAGIALLVRLVLWAPGLGSRYSPDTHPGSGADGGGFGGGGGCDGGGGGA